MHLLLWKSCPPLKCVTRNSFLALSAARQPGSHLSSGTAQPQGLHGAASPLCLHRADFRGALTGATMLNAFLWCPKSAGGLVPSSGLSPLALPATAHWSSQGSPPSGLLPGSAKPNPDLQRPQPGPRSLLMPCSPGCGHTPLQGPAAELLHGVGFPAKPTACLVCLLPPVPWTHKI